MNLPRLLLGAVPALSYLASFAALPLNQRPAKPDEWGYRPADGATVPLNPPTFTWLVPDATAATYSVQWSRDRDFRAATTATDIVWPTYTHHEAVAPGTWYWRYRCANREQIFRLLSGLVR